MKRDSGGVRGLKCILIVFPLTPLQKKIKSTGARRYSELEEYKLQQKLDRVAARHGYQRTSIWTYGRKGAKRYTSVTRETFMGLGASATSLYDRYFYLNTFNVEEYIKALDTGSMPISLVNHMNEREKQVFWLFWRCYDTEIPRRRFCSLFGEALDRTFPLLTMYSYAEKLPYTTSVKVMAMFENRQDVGEQLAGALAKYRGEDK